MKEQRTEDTPVKRWRHSWQESWQEIWNRVCKYLPPRKENREAFQLVAAALIYQFNAVKQLPDDLLHCPAAGPRDKPEGWEWAGFEELYGIAQLPSFSIETNSRAAREKFGTMHLASASFRLPTALWLAEKNESSSLDKYKRCGDWKREALYNILSEDK